MKLLRKLREERKLSRARLSILSGVNATTVYELEVGRRTPYPKAMRLLSEALGWDGDPTELFCEVSDDAGE